MPLHPSRHRAGHPCLQRAFLRLDMRRYVYHNKRFKVVILTTTGRILTKEYAAINGGAARKKALLPNEVERILAVEEIHEHNQPK